MLDFLGKEANIRYFYHKAKLPGQGGGVFWCDYLGVIWMKRLFGTVFAVFLTLVLFFVLLPVLILPGLLTGEKNVDLPELALLELDLGQTLTDQPLSNQYRTSREAVVPSVIRVVEALATAESDVRVSGLLVTMAADIDLPVAQAEEIRGALKSFRAKGKFVIVHAQEFKSENPGAYYAASESDQLWMEPDGDFASADIEVRSLFNNNLSHAVEPSMSTRQPEDNHSVVNAFTQPALAGARRQIYGSVLKTIEERTIAGIAESKGLSAEAVYELLHDGPYTSGRAMSAGLVSHLGASVEARASALELAGVGARPIAWHDYLNAVGPLYDEGAVIAVVYAEGAISPDEEQASGINGDVTAQAIRDAADDKAVEAVLFRIDSAGGSPVASDQIWNAVKYARDSGKPVIVSMGSVAASGGYYVAMAADRIIAQPTTITGSIGLVDGKFVLGGAYGSLGLTVSDTAAGASGIEADIEEGKNEAPWQSVNQVLGDFYADFTVKVAQERGMSLAAVHEVASGRVWSGEQARDLGLIDDLGGFRYAIGETKKMMGLEASAPVELRTWPGPASPWQRIMQLMDVSGSATRVMLMFSQLGQIDTIRDLKESVYNGSQSGALPENATSADPID